jgi:hypothetical protein
VSQRLRVESVEKPRVGVAAGPQQNAGDTLWLTTELFLSGKLRNISGAVHNHNTTVVGGRHPSESIGAETRAGISRLCGSASSGSASRLARPRRPTSLTLPLVYSKSILIITYLKRSHWQMSYVPPPTLSQPKRSGSTSKPKGILKNAPPAGVSAQR